MHMANAVIRTHGVIVTQTLHIKLDEQISQTVIPINTQRGGAPSPIYNNINIAGARNKSRVERS